MHLLWRFIIGGFFVCLFSVLGDSFKPQTFAGLFGSAPSIALAGFILIWARQGATFVTVEARSMICGAIAMLVYCVSSVLIIRKTNMAAGVAAILLWLEWF